MVEHSLKILEFAFSVCPSRGLTRECAPKDLIGIYAVQNVKFQISIFSQVVTLLKLLLK